jgi:hypothetical protein
VLFCLIYKTTATSYFSTWCKTSGDPPPPPGKLTVVAVVVVVAVV